MKKFYFKEKLIKITDHYKVLDENGDEAYYVDQDLKLVGHKVNIKNLKSGEYIIVKQKLLNLLPTYEVKFGDGTTMYVNSKLSLMKRKVNVKYEGDRLSLKGNLWDFSFKIYRDNHLLGSLNKKIVSLADQYVLKVEDENYADLLVALTICINHMKDTEKHRRSENN